MAGIIIAFDTPRRSSKRQYAPPLPKPPSNGQTEKRISATGG
jgi:hypothetical protein